MITILIGVIAAMALALMVATVSWGDTTASQKLTVHVPLRGEVTAPPAANATRAAKEGNTIFEPQRWVVGGNNVAGLVVDFSIQHAFTHVDQPAQKCDARISLKIANSEGEAMWIVTRDGDATNLSLSDEIASVQATSSAVGIANLDLQIEFVSEANEVVVPGNYGTTVTTTISMN